MSAPGTAAGEWDFGFAIRGKKTASNAANDKAAARVGARRQGVSLGAGGRVAATLRYRAEVGAGDQVVMPEVHIGEGDGWAGFYLDTEGNRIEPKHA